MAKIGLGLSGGVDSAVAAYLLQKAGHEVLALHMTLSPDSLGSQEEEDARALAQAMGLDFHRLDGRDLFEKNIIQPFIQAYLQGQTPNPCITCNGQIKFGFLWAQAQDLGCDLIATGHYATMGQDDQGRPRLFQGTDVHKDQSYFMVRLPASVLPFLVLPLGPYTKDQVRALALEAGLPVAQKKDSQEICFIPNDDYVAFLQDRKATSPPGPFVDAQGQILGTHKGVTHYTIGQRRGLGIALGKPAYVTAINAQAHTVTLGPDQDLWQTGLVAIDPVFHCPLAPGTSGRALAKIRSRGPGQEATWTFQNNKLFVQFEDPIRALSPGQALVLYEGPMVLGGGQIIGPWTGPIP